MVEGGNIRCGRSHCFTILLSLYSKCPVGSHQFPKSNDPATKLAKEMKATSKSKHWLLKYHLCRQNMSQGITLPLRVPTKDNNSDCGTKCQSAPDFTKLRKRLTGYAKSFTPPEWEPLPLPAWTPITELPNTIDDG